MNTYRFVLEIPAHSQAEAKAKLDLLLQLGAFFKDFNGIKLTESLLAYWLLHAAGKAGVKVSGQCYNDTPDSSENKSEK